MTRQPAFFERDHGAWILSTWADVSAGLSHPDLVIAAGAVLVEPVEVGTRQSPTWWAELEDSARRRVAALPRGQSVDLLAEYAFPWARELAGRVAGVSGDTVDQLLPMARAVFQAAAFATGPEMSPPALDSAARLGSLLPPDPIAVQAFVALTHTLPHLLASAWDLLLQHPEQVRLTRDDRSLLPAVMEELIRLAGPSRTVYRVARAPVEIGEARMATGDRVHLRLAVANRDPLRFADPDRFDPGRPQSGHLGFGRGRHACAGAQLIRAAAQTATAALLEGPWSFARAGEPTWLEGTAIRAAASLPVVLEVAAQPR